MTEEYRFVCCSACDGSGIYEDGDYGSEPCSYCDGYGSEQVEVEPITMEDLDRE